MVTQTLQCDQIFKVLNVFQANYLSVEERRMEPQSLSSVTSGRKARSSHGAQNLSTREGEAGAGRRGQGGPGNDNRGPGQRAMDLDSGLNFSTILSTAPAGALPSLASRRAPPPFPAVFLQRPKDYILVVGGGRGWGGPGGLLIRLPRQRDLDSNPTFATQQLCDFGPVTSPL